MYQVIIRNANRDIIDKHTTKSRETAHAIAVSAKVVYGTDCRAVIHDLSIVPEI